MHLKMILKNESLNKNNILKNNYLQHNQHNRLIHVAYKTRHFLWNNKDIQMFLDNLTKNDHFSHYLKGIHDILTKNNDHFSHYIWNMWSPYQKLMTISATIYSIHTVLTKNNDHSSHYIWSIRSPYQKLNTISATT